jgi:hypothetical protein
MAERKNEPQVLLVEIRLCELCLSGAGGECHVPGCALFLRSAPDLRLDPATDYATVPPGSVRVSEGAVRMVLRWLGYPRSNPALCRGALDEFDATVRHG